VRAGGIEAGEAGHQEEREEDGTRGHGREVEGAGGEDDGFPKP
jgi:hypothetical protein